MNCTGKILTILILALSSVVYAENPLPEEFQDLNWYRYVTNNFEILSIDEQQGEFLYKNIEKVKSWTFRRWGMNDIVFQNKCQIICVPTDELFSRFFRKKDIIPRWSKNDSAIWVSLDKKTKGNWIKTVVPEKITEICLSEWSYKYNIEVDRWLKDGMSVLNGGVYYIRDNLNKLNCVDGQGRYINGGMSVEKIFNMDDEQIKALSDSERQIYKMQSCVLVLLFKRELQGGNIKFKEFFRSSPEQAIVAYGFRDFDQLDRIYRTYMYRLCWDIRNGKTPKTYFTWFSK